MVDTDSLHTQTTPLRGKRVNRIAQGSASEDDDDDGHHTAKGHHEALSSPESLSSSSSKATIRADRDSDQGPSSDEEAASDYAGEDGSVSGIYADMAGPSSSHAAAWANGDLRTRSISAPSSRSSSFQRNLDQLAMQSQSAHHFPAVLQSGLTNIQKPAASNGEAEESVLVSSSIQNGRPNLTHRDSSASTRSRASSQSMPSSPQMTARRTAGQIGMPARPRSSLFATGSGFTPATELASGQAPRTTGRMRSTSASEASSSSSSVPLREGTSPGTTHSSFPRQRIQSARTSPALRPLQPLTPAESANASTRNDADRPQPHRTRSTPHLPQVSPVVYGLGIPYGTLNGSTVYATSPGANWEGYFTLPPPAAPAHRTRSDEESPPPYTPSGTNLVALGAVAEQTIPRQHSTSRRNSRSHPSTATEEDEDALSFSARSASRTVQRARSQRSLGDESSATRVDPAVLSSNGNISAERGEISATEDLDAEQWQYIDRLERPSKLRQFVLTYLLHPLRLLAAIPGCIGTFWLLRNAAVIYMRDGTLLFKDKKALQNDIAARPSGLEFALSALWSLATAFHALSFTTLLLRRWLHYYSLVPSLIRLVALQAICWPLVRLTLHILGPLNPLPGWVIISSTTAFSDTVARWVVSNITDESTASAVEGAATAETPAEPITGTHSGRRRRRYRTRRTGKVHKVAMAFWRTIMGAPPRQSDGRVYANTVAGERGFITESEAELDSDIDGGRGSLGRLGRSNDLRRPTSRHQTLASLRRRHGTLRDADDLTSGHEGDDTDQDGFIGNERRGRRAALDHAAGAERRIQRVGRIFHWDVAVKRNLLPLCILAYMTMWALLIEVTRSRW